jgi:hypothetical protein
MPCCGNIHTLQLLRSAIKRSFAVAIALLSTGITAIQATKRLPNP